VAGDGEGCEQATSPTSTPRAPTPWRGTETRGCCGGTGSRETTADNACIARPQPPPSPDCESVALRPRRLRLLALRGGVRRLHAAVWLVVLPVRPGGGGRGGGRSGLGLGGESLRRGREPASHAAGRLWPASVLGAPRPYRHRRGWTARRGRAAAARAAGGAARGGARAGAQQRGAPPPPPPPSPPRPPSSASVEALSRYSGHHTRHVSRPASSSRWNGATGARRHRRARTVARTTRPRIRARAARRALLWFRSALGSRRE